MSSEEDSIQELWQFPCEFMFKAMAQANVGAEDEVVAVIQRFVPGDYAPKISPSKNGNYIAITVTFMATSKALLDEIYLAVNQLDNVKFCL